MRIYIAGPMTGLPDWNYPAFHSAAEAWRKAGWDVVNPAEAFGGATDRAYEEYVDHDIDVLKTVDAIAMLPGWNGPNARGSVWERGIALKLLNLTVYDAEHPVFPPRQWKNVYIGEFVDAAIPLTRSRAGVLDRWRAVNRMYDAENTHGQG